MTLDHDDESGILISLLYLLGEAEKRGMTFCAAKIIEAAHAMLLDCKDNPEMHDSLEAALKIFMNFSLMDKDRIAKIFKNLEEHNSNEFGRVIFSNKFKGKLND